MKSYRGLSVRSVSSHHFLSNFGEEDNHFIIRTTENNGDIGCVRLILDHQTEFLQQQMNHVTKGVNRIHGGGKIKYRRIFRDGHQFVLPANHVLTRNFCSDMDKLKLTELIKECLMRILTCSYAAYHVIVEIRNNRTDDVWKHKQKTGFWGISQASYGY